MRNELIKKTTLGTALLAICAATVLISGCSGYNAKTTVTTQSKTSTTAAVTSTFVQPKTTTPTSTKTSISLSIPNRTVKAGDIFQIDVVINTDQELRSGQCGLTFDPTLIQCSKVEEGGFFKDWAQQNKIITMVLPQAQIDNTKGVVSTMADALMGMVPGGATGTGTFCTYSFTALKDGTVSPKLTDVELGVQQDDLVVALGGVQINN